MFRRLALCGTERPNSDHAGISADIPDEASEPNCGPELSHYSRLGPGDCPPFSVLVF